jgi:DNA-directed RNA polymerase omega subunit
MPIPTSELLEDVGSSYVLALVAAKRAKQLREGAPQLVECESNHSLTIALEEIAQHKVRPVLRGDEEPEAEDLLEEETLMSLEADLALPALEEDEETTADLSDLLDEEEEAEREEEDEEAEEEAEEKAAADEDDIAPLIEEEEDEGVSAEEEVLEKMTLEGEDEAADEEDGDDEGEAEE